MQKVKHDFQLANREISLGNVCMIQNCIIFSIVIHVYSQTRSSVPPKKWILMNLMNLLFKCYSKVESVASCRLQIDLCILACVMSREFTREAVMKFLPAPFSWIWCKCLLRNLIHSKIFNLTKYREVLVKYSLLITHAEMPLWIWHQLRERLTDSFFK